MKFSLFYFPQLGMGDPNTYDRGRIGNDPEQYAYLLEDLRLQAQFADDAGFWGVYFAEHHFNVEGFEMSHNPLLLDYWVGMHTKRIKLGQLGLVLPAWNPLRLAEDIASMTLMFGDRFELGFARGSQAREVAPLAALHHAASAGMPGSEMDQRNRRLFRETYEIIMKALTEDFLSHAGEFYEIPPQGVSWPNPATKKYGGGVGPGDQLQQIAVVPKPRNRKLPVRWQAFSFSEETMRWAGREGLNLAIIDLRPEKQREYQEAYVEESEKGGRKLAYGEGVGYTRSFLCLDDAEAAHRYNKAMADRMWGEWFGSVGFTELFRWESDPQDRPVPYSYELITQRGFDFTGSPDDVTRQIEKLYENTQMEHLHINHQVSGVPRDILMKSLETFAEKVMPRFDVQKPEEPMKLEVAAAT